MSRIELDESILEGFHSIMKNVQTEARLLAMVAGLVIIGCSKVPERLTITTDDQLLTMEWTSVVVEKVPVYWSGIKTGILKPLKELDQETQKKISEELINTKGPEARYEPEIKISENSYNQAVNWLSSIFQVSKEDARDALPSKDQWSLSVIHTNQTKPILESSPELWDEYFNLAKDIPFESVKCDPSMLCDFLTEQAAFLKTSKTLAKHIKPESAYVIRRNANPSNVVFVVVPEDQEWGGVDAYYQKHCKDQK